MAASILRLDQPGVGAAASRRAASIRHNCGCVEFVSIPRTAGITSGCCSSARRAKTCSAVITRRGRPRPTEVIVQLKSVASRFLKPDVLRLPVAVAASDLVRRQTSEIPELLPVLPAGFAVGCGRSNRSLVLSDAAPSA